MTEQQEVEQKEPDTFQEARERADSFFQDEEVEVEETITDDQASEEVEEEKMVPISALQAERQKRQEMEAQKKLYAEQLDLMKKAPKEEPEDLDEIVDMKLLKEQQQALRMQLREDAWMDNNPEKLEFINERLEELCTKEPWARQAVESADNRYAMAYKLCKKFMGDESATTAPASLSPQQKAKQMVENGKKPRSTFGNKTPPQQSQADYLKKIAGTAEFREFRKRLRGK